MQPELAAMVQPGLGALWGECRAGVRKGHSHVRAERSHVVTARCRVKLSSSEGSTGPDAPSGTLKYMASTWHGQLAGILAGDGRWDTPGSLGLLRTRQVGSMQESPRRDRQKLEGLLRPVLQSPECLLCHILLVQHMGEEIPFSQGGHHNQLHLPSTTYYSRPLA